MFIIQNLFTNDLDHGFNKAQEGKITSIVSFFNVLFLKDKSNNRFHL